MLPEDGDAYTAAAEQKNPLDPNTLIEPLVQMTMKSFQSRSSIRVFQMKRFYVWRRIVDVYC